MSQALSQDRQTQSTIETVNRFNEAFNRHDVDAIMEVMTGDCVFENTSPQPDGTRHEGAGAVRKAWEELFTASPNAHFTEEEMFAAGDRCVVRWRYDWTDEKGQRGHMRGVDIFRVKDGRVAEKLAYVKG